MYRTHPQPAAQPNQPAPRLTPPETRPNGEYFNTPTLQGQGALQGRVVPEPQRVPPIIPGSSSPQEDYRARPALLAQDARLRARGRLLCGAPYDAGQTAEIGRFAKPHHALLWRLAVLGHSPQLKNGRAGPRSATGRSARVLTLACRASGRSCSCATACSSCCWCCCFGSRTALQKTRLGNCAGSSHAHRCRLRVRQMFAARRSSAHLAGPLRAFLLRRRRLSPVERMSHS